MARPAPSPPPDAGCPKLWRSRAPKHQNGTEAGFASLWSTRCWSGRGDEMKRLGIAFSGGASPAEIVDCVKLAEQLGYESAWVAEGHGGDQFAVLAACARETSRIGLGTGITSVFVHTAPTIAMAAATVDDVSGGRFILGIGS